MSKQCIVADSSSAAPRRPHFCDPPSRVIGRIFCSSWPISIEAIASAPQETPRSIRRISTAWPHGGALFRNAYSSTPTCTPARAALLTGMSPWNHGMLGYGAVAPHYRVEMPRLLHDAGYYTAGIGKMHWHPQRALHGFDQTILDESGRVESPDFRSDYRSWFWSEDPDADPDATGSIGTATKPGLTRFPETLHPTSGSAKPPSAFCASYNKPQPFFLKVSFERPHSPYDPPKRWWDRYDSPLPPSRRVAWAAKFRPRSSNRADIWHGDVGAALVQNARRGYYGSVSFVDEQIGRILETLDRRGWLQRTSCYLSFRSRRYAGRSIFVAQELCLPGVSPHSDDFALARRPAGAGRLAPESR